MKQKSFFMFKKKFSDDEIRSKAHELWRTRKGEENTSADDWNAAIAALKTERSLINRFYEWTGLKKKTGWDFLQLLIVPTVLSFGALYLQYEAKQREDKALEDKEKQDTLTKYFDQMAELLLKEKLLQTLTNSNSEIFIIGQSKTVTVLQSLDPTRQNLVIQFLKSANLNGNDSANKVFKFLYLKSFLKKGLLYQAQMSNINLSYSNLNESNLSYANLINTIFFNAKLIGSDFSYANLIGANLIRANLSYANLIGSNLTNANLSGSYLINADLTNADLTNANLTNANLIGANLDIKQIEATCYWQSAKFSDTFRKQLDMSISQKVNPSCNTFWYHN